MSAWFSVGLLYRADHGREGGSGELWEERVVLVRAETEGAAMDAAASLGKSREAHYKGLTGDRVQWRFEGAWTICELLDDELGVGSEVFWRFMSGKQVKALRKEFK
jgi:hypothetical protein